VKTLPSSVSVVRAYIDRDIRRRGGGVLPKRVRLALYFFERARLHEQASFVLLHGARVRFHQFRPGEGSVEDVGRCFGIGQ